MHHRCPCHLLRRVFCGPFLAAVARKAALPPHTGCSFFFFFNFLFNWRLFLVSCRPRSFSDFLFY